GRWADGDEGQHPRRLCPRHRAVLPGPAAGAGRRALRRWWTDSGGPSEDRAAAGRGSPYRCPLMNRKAGGGAAAAVLVVGAGFSVRRCDPINLNPPDIFSYAVHERPRVFISHHPLIPAPGGNLTLTLAPDLPAGVSVQRAVAVLVNPADGSQDTKQCNASGGGFDCQFTLGSSGATRHYLGFVELSTGTRADTRATYALSVLASVPADTLIAVRVPLKTPANLQDGYSIDTAFARDPDNYGLPAFVDDVEKSLFDGILADPAYRWRDNQLGFFVFTHDALVTSYYSGLNTRCGQNPWPLESALPAALQP